MEDKIEKSFSKVDFTTYNSNFAFQNPVVASRSAIRTREKSPGEDYYFGLKHGHFTNFSVEGS